MIPGVKDALIFVMLEDGTVHQVHLPKGRTLDVLKRFGDQLKLCEVAEPMTWERPNESGAGGNPGDPLPSSRQGQGQGKEGVQFPPPEPVFPDKVPYPTKEQKKKLEEDYKSYISKTKYLDTKTGKLKLY
jgi:hypothetical protein